MASWFGRLVDFDILCSQDVDIHLLANACVRMRGFVRHLLQMLALDTDSLQATSIDLQSLSFETKKLG